MERYIDRELGELDAVAHVIRWETKRHGRAESDGWRNLGDSRLL
jgi:hypothetical protein